MRVRTRNRMLLAGLGLIALAGVAIMAGGQSAFDWADRVTTGRLVSSLDAEVTAEVPQGADLPTVVMWFKKHNVGFQYYLGTDPPSPDPNRPGTSFHGLAPAQVADAAVGTTSKHSLGHRHLVFIYFYFGRDGRAIKHIVYAPAG